MIKALKSQEERKERKAARKKQVREGEREGARSGSRSGRAGRQAGRGPKCRSFKLSLVKAKMSLWELANKILARRYKHMSCRLLA